jgi:hypothetical protein
MTTLTDTASITLGGAAAVRPSRLRRTALAVTGLLAGILPVVWTLNIARMMLTGVEAEHRFHQATGQGLLLTALWLGAVATLLRAGWAGRRPSTSSGLLHLAFVLVGLVCALVSPGGGALSLMLPITVTGALQWIALPLRPRLRSRVQLDPVRAPVALLAAGLYIPYAIDQLAAQKAAIGYHAQNPHFFDMAWVVLVLTVLGLAAACVSSARRLIAWVAAGSLTIGAAGLAFGERWVFSALALALGLLASAVAAGRRRPVQSR